MQEALLCEPLTLKSTLLKIFARLCKEPMRFYFYRRGKGFSQRNRSGIALREFE
jgi:hypothetical protein